MLTGLPARLNAPKPGSRCNDEAPASGPLVYRQTGVGAMTAIDTCPGCGYPQFGPDLCAYCRPALTLEQEPSTPLRGPAGGFTDGLAAAPAV